MVLGWVGQFSLSVATALLEKYRAFVKLRQQIWLRVDSVADLYKAADDE